MSAIRLIPGHHFNSTRYTASQAEMLNGITMDLPDYPAHYTAYASFYDQNGNLYEAEFWFNIREVERN